MPQSQEEHDRTKANIDAALTGLGAGATTGANKPNPNQGAVSPMGAANQLPINEDERRAMAEAVSKITGGSK